MSFIQSAPALPSTGRLLRATALAIVVAGSILLTTVLPAEYGIDPTGIGARLGLTKLAQSDAAPETSASTPAATPSAEPSPALDAVGQPAKAVQDSMVNKRAGAYRQHTMELTLEPRKGAEIKAQMKSGDGIVFHWTATAELAVDMHGEATDAPKDEYTSYWIERAQREGAGSFTAPFDGTHGWYWLNRSTEPVTVKVEVTGFHEKLFRPGH